MIYTLRNFKIEIDLKPGIYLFERESATGKTYLYRKLRSLIELGENVFAVTYNYWINSKESYIKSLKNQLYDVVMFDRFNLYYENMDDLLLRQSKTE